MTAPKVTVLMPVRNGAAFLEEACRSILAQDFPSFEFLILDDGSTDQTPAILARLAGDDARIRVVTLPPTGLVATLNRGLREARAAYVARMDADDLARPDRLALQAACLDSRESLAVVGSAWRVIDSAGRVLRDADVPLDFSATLEVLRQRNCIAHPSVMMRRDAVLAAGGYRAAFVGAEDYDLWLRLSDEHRLMNLPERLLSYREHPGQATRTGLERGAMAELAARAAADRRRRLGSDGMASEAPVTRDTLRQLGLGDREIDHGLIAVALGTAKAALRSGDAATVRTAVALVQRQRATPLRTRLHCALLWLRAAALGLRA